MIRPKWLGSKKKEKEKENLLRMHNILNGKMISTLRIWSVATNLGK